MNSHHEFFRPFVVLVRSDGKEEAMITIQPRSAVNQPQEAVLEEQMTERTDEEWWQILDEMRKGQGFDL